ncbi:MAG TPA: hypothetical protein VIJ22_06645 [Polyangiaceae bacterium]
MTFSIRARLKSRDMTWRIFFTVSQPKPASWARSSTWRTWSSVTFPSGSSPITG